MKYGSMFNIDIDSVLPPPKMYYLILFIIRGYLPVNVA